jgi:hypothetical protein
MVMMSFQRMTDLQRSLATYAERLVSSGPPPVPTHTMSNAGMTERGEIYRQHQKAGEVLSARALG